MMVPATQLHVASRFSTAHGLLSLAERRALIVGFCDLRREFVISLAQVPQHLVFVECHGGSTDVVILGRLVAGKG